MMRLELNVEHRILSNKNKLGFVPQPSLHF